MTIQTSHVIFSRVEARYSSKNTSGYQVVYSSDDIVAEDVLAIERRVKCFNYARNMGVVRHQFFWTPSKKATVVRSVPVEGHPDIIDRDRRPGAFVAHAIILSEDDFNKIYNDPFAVFEQAHEVFTSSPEQLKDYLEGPAPPAIIDISNRKKLSPSTHLSLGVCESLFDLGSSAFETLRSQNTTLFLKTENLESRYDIFSSVLFMVEAKDRIHCTFDTHVDTCEPKPGEYWAVGGLAVNTSGFLVVDTAQPTIQEVKKKAVNQETLYGYWIRRQIRKAESTTALFDQVYSGQTIARAFAKGEVPSGSEVSEDVLRSFWGANEKALDQKLKQAISDHLNGQIAEASLVYMRTELPVETLLTIIVSERIIDRDLAPYLFNWLTMGNSDVSKWKDVLKFGLAVDHPGLLLLASNRLYRPRAPFTNRLNKIETTRQKALKRLTQSDRAGLVLESLTGIVPPKWFITKETANLVPGLCSEKMLSKLDDEEFASLVIEIIDNDGGSAIDEKFVKRVNRVALTKAAKDMAEKALKDKQVTIGFKTAVRQFS
jgi:hypothetical protein